ncbi:MAG: 2-C-methyl-D-erythritol 4-phosphate cytidylyltransferase [Candidatus Omnitrophota bacterium]
MKTSVIVAAGGKGERLGSKVHKPFVLLGKEPILAYALRALDSSNRVNEIILVVNEFDLLKGRSLVKKIGIKKIKDITAGGKRRMDSVNNGLFRVSPDTDYVMVHDGCRPFVDDKIISETIQAAEIFGGAIAVAPVKPTIKEIEKGGFVVTTLKREFLVEVQTPQVFRKDILVRAYERALREETEATDDSSLVEALGVKVKVIKGSYKNIKITTPEDLKYAKALLGL